MYLAGLLAPRESKGQCLGAEQAEKRRQHPQGREHDHEHGKRRSDSEAGEEVDAQDEQPEQSDDHRSAGKEHGPTGGLDGLHRRILGRMTGKDGLPEPVHDEQRVVDANAKTDHRSERGCERRNVEEVGDDKNRHLAHGQTHDGDDNRHAGRNDGPEGDQENDDGDEDADALTARWLLTGEVEHLAVGSDREIRSVECFHSAENGLRIRSGDRVAIGGKGDRGVGNLAVGTHRRHRLLGGLRCLSERSLLVFGHRSEVGF